MSQTTRPTRTQPGPGPGPKPGSRPKARPKPSPGPDRLDHVIALAEGIERAANRALAAMRMPNGSRELDAAQDAAMAAVDREVAALRRLAARLPGKRGPR